MLFSIFLILDLYFLIFVVITQMFIPTAELVKNIGIPTNEAHAKNKIRPVIVETKTSKCLL